MIRLSRVHTTKAVLIQLAIAAFLFAMPLFPQESAQPQAAPEQPDISALMQKIRDLEDRIIAMEGQMRQLKEQQAAAQPVPSAGTWHASRRRRRLPLLQRRRAVGRQARPPSSRLLWAAPGAVRPRR